MLPENWRKNALQVADSSPVQGPPPLRPCSFGNQRRGIYSNSLHTEALNHSPKTLQLQV